MITDELLAFVVSWYQQHCDGDWEHSYGVSFVHTRTEGWVMACDLVGIALEGHESDWLPVASHSPRLGHWRVTGSRFEATARTGDLWGAFYAFKSLVAQPAPIARLGPEPLVDLLESRVRDTQQLIGDAQPIARVDTLDNPGWSVMVRTDATAVAGLPSPIIRIDKSETEWLHWWSTKDTFEAACGAGDLAWALRRFGDFVGTTPQ